MHPLLPLLFLALTVTLALLHAAHPPSRRWAWKALAAIAALMLPVGLWLAFRWAPPDREMGDVQRIMYAHVPEVWMALLALTLNFGCSVFYLFKANWVADNLAEASAEVGLLFGGTGVLLGSIWAKPTWGVYWDWDPRLTTASIMLLYYAGYMAFRKLLDDPEKRATFSAVLGILGAVNVPLVWFSVRWWRSLHQIQSSPKTVDPEMTLVLRWWATLFLAVLVVFLIQRYRLAAAQRTLELEPAPEIAVRGVPQ